MAGRGQVSWLPGYVPRLPGDAVASPVADAARWCPVTVAGPRRFFTGLPLTTGRMSNGIVLRKEEGRPRGRPSQLLQKQEEDSYFFFFFFFFFFEGACVQGVLAVADRVGPPERNVVVSDVVHVPSLHFAVM